MKNGANENVLNHAPPDRVEREVYVRPRQSFAVQIGKGLRDPVNAWFARQSLIDADPFADCEQLPGLSRLRDHWLVIREELESLLDHPEKIPAFGKVSPDHRRIADGPQWKSFFVQGYGFRSEKNCQKCPRTAGLLDQVPGLVVAFFSILEGDAQIPLHRGLTKAWLNCHLGLIVPDSSLGRCEIEVAGKVRRWQEGQWLVFDETFQHRVCNESGQPRAVLMLQVERPMRPPARVAAAALRWMIAQTSFVRDVRKALED